MRLLAHEGSRGGRLNLEVPFDDVELGPIVDFLDANKVAQLLFKPDRPRHHACHYNTSETTLIIVGVESNAAGEGGSWHGGFQTPSNRWYSSYGFLL